MNNFDHVTLYITAMLLFMASIGIGALSSYWYRTKVKK